MRVILMRYRCKQLRNRWRRYYRVRLSLASPCDPPRPALPALFPPPGITGSFRRQKGAVAGVGVCVCKLARAAGACSSLAGDLGGRLWLVVNSLVLRREDGFQGWRAHAHQCVVCLCTRVWVSAEVGEELCV